MPVCYEVYVRNEWIEVTREIFRSWDGRRKRNGKLYYGPVYLLGTKQVAK